MSMTDRTPGPETGGQSLADSLLGQAAAGITLAAALIYGAGALTVALRLYFTHLPWAAVLGQLPHDLIITTGFGQVVLPASIIGMLGAILLNFLANQPHKPEDNKRTAASFLQAGLRGYLKARPSSTHFAAWLLTSLLLGVAEAGIALPSYLYHKTGYIHTGVLISWPSFFLTVALVSAIAVGITLILMPPPRPLPALPPVPPAAEPSGSEADAATGASDPTESKLSTWQWQAIAGALVAFAAIPGAAAISASTLYPPALICSPTFHNGQLSGNLIATSGEWAYMVEYRTTNYSHDYFSVVPLSSVRLMTIGTYGDCATLAPTPATSPVAHPSATP